MATSAMSISGMVSGLQTDSIIAKLQQVEQAPITRMQTQQKTLSTKMDAWSSLNTRALAVKSKAADLADLLENQTKRVTSSSDTISASATSSATTGTYTFKVESLASYHQITTQAYTDTDTTSVGSGTYKMTVDGTATTLNVDNLSLSGLRDAINNSDAGVQAMIVSTGGTAPEYRLVLTSDTLGSAGAITVESTLTGGVPPTLTDLHAASDTKLTFGSGDNAFSITRSKTTLDDVITGVTINLTQDSEGETTTLTVKQDTTSVKSGIQDLVTQYNALLDYIAQETTYNSDSGETGPLFGEYQAESLKSQLASQLTGQVDGLSTDLSTVSQLGIAFNDNGRLEIDSDTLTTALKDNLQGVLRLFAASGTSTNTALTYAGSDENTQASGAAGYAINITAAATQARLSIGTTGSGLPSALGQDETLTIGSTKIELLSGMSQAQVLAAVNAKATDTGVRAYLTGADGTGAGNYLTFIRTAYGTGSKVDVVSSVAAGETSTGIGTTAISSSNPGADNIGAAGRDVVGTINGEAATGSGQLLTSAAGKAKGLQLLVTGTTTGDYGNFVYTVGVGARIDHSLNFVTDATSGNLQQLQESLQKQIDELGKNITSDQESVNRYMDRVRNQFNGMEVALSKLQNQASQLTSLIAQLS